MTAEPATQIADAVKNRRRAAELAARALAAGGLVAFPTETVYGLGADATNGRAVARLYEAKGRPSFNPLIAHVAGRRGRARARPISIAAAERLAAAFWPGPLTLVLPKARRLPGRRSRHRRARQHRAARARPSGGAGPAGGVRPAGGGAVGQSLRPRLADHGGACARRPARPHRPDRRRRADADRARIDHRRLPRRADAAAARARSPARRSSACSAAPLAHARGRSPTTRRWRRASSPRTTRRGRGCGSTRRSVEPGEALLAFGPNRRAGAEHAARVLNLSPTRRPDRSRRQPVLASARARRRRAPAIAVMPVPHEGLGEAINDRLARAAAPRDS